MKHKVSYRIVSLPNLRLEFPSLRTRFHKAGGIKHQIDILTNPDFFIIRNCSDFLKSKPENVSFIRLYLIEESGAKLITRYQETNE